MVRYFRSRWCSLCNKYSNKIWSKAAWRVRDIEREPSSIWKPQLCCTLKLVLKPSSIPDEAVDFNDENWTECKPGAEEDIDKHVHDPQVETMHFTMFKLGNAPIYFYCIYQNTFESSSYGIELIVMRTITFYMSSKLFYLLSKPNWNRLTQIITFNIQSFWW